MNGLYIHQTACIDEDTIIGDDTKVCHFSNIQTGAKIGKKCSLGQNVYVGANVVIGDRVKIQNNVSIYEGVTLEDDVFCGPSCVFTNDLTPRARYPKGSANYKKTLVEKGSTIGANATIVCGINIGKYAMIGAGAVVSKNVPDYALVVGNPAKIVGYVCECGHKLDNDGMCPICQKKVKK